MSTLSKPTATKYYSSGFQREQWPCFQENSLKNRGCPQAARPKGWGSSRSQLVFQHWSNSHCCTGLSSSSLPGLGWLTGTSDPGFHFKKEGTVGMVLKSRIFCTVTGFVLGQQKCLHEMNAAGSLGVCGAPTRLPGHKKTLTALAYSQSHLSHTNSTMEGLVQATRHKAQWKSSLELSGCKRENSAPVAMNKVRPCYQLGLVPPAETICPFQ